MSALGRSALAAVGAGAMSERYTPEQMRAKVERARQATGLLRDSARTGVAMGYRERDPLVLAVHAGLDIAEAAATDAEALAELRRQAVSLAKEVNGQLSLEGPSIREAIGNTNYRCLSDKALAVLSLTGDATEGQG